MTHTQPRTFAACNCPPAACPGKCPTSATCSRLVHRFQGKVTVVAHVAHVAIVTHAMPGAASARRPSAAGAIAQHCFLLHGHKHGLQFSASIVFLRHLPPPFSSFKEAASDQATPSTTVSESDSSRSLRYQWSNYHCQITNDPRTWCSSTVFLTFLQFLPRNSSAVLCFVFFDNMGKAEISISAHAPMQIEVS